MIWRNLFSVRVCKLFIFPHYGNLLSRFFSKNFVKSMHLLNKLLKIDLTGKNLVRVNFSFFHSVLCRNNGTSFLHLFDKNFVKATFSTIELISRDIFSVRENFFFSPHFTDTCMSQDFAKILWVCEINCLNKELFF